MEAQQEGRRECDLGSVVGTVMLCFRTADTTNIDGSSSMQRHSGGKYRPRSRSELQSTQTCQVPVRVTVRVRECASSYLGAIFLCLSQQKDLFQFLGGGGGERKNECVQARCSVCSAQPPHAKLEFLLLQKQRQCIANHVYFHKDLAHG